MIDPLSSAEFKAPGLWENLREALLGSQRKLDCVQIEITSICSGLCLYCPHTTQKERWQSSHLDAATLAKLWPLLRITTRAHLQGWGEPLLHPRFLDFQEFCARAGCLTSTTSCGLKMDETLAERLAASGMDIIAFSLVGTDKGTNGARANVPFEKVCTSIRCLRKAISRNRSSQPLEIHFAYLLLADRMEAVLKLPELMEELDVEMSVISTLDYLSVPEHRSLAFRSDEEEKIAKAREVLEKARERADAMGRIIHYALPGKIPAINGCRENITKSLYMDRAGNLSPCIYRNVPGSAGAHAKAYGNVNENSPLDIWHNVEYQKFRQDLLGQNPDAFCRDCPKRVEEAQV